VRSFVADFGWGTWAIRTGALNPVTNSVGFLAPDSQINGKAVAMDEQKRLTNLVNLGVRTLCL
jgi:hypothetical protein